MNTPMEIFGLLVGAGIVFHLLLLVVLSLLYGVRIMLESDSSLSSRRRRRRVRQGS